ncbi:MAG: DNA polymerase III subunit gamma/tau [Furfurilactobacillus sp.]|jgi:DNA polymerase-3 subunit gamma/tau|uniref:DNA-directed DNA polymerase n=1 Tax=Furfurilactobacillus milii TaxID=2888272 RepID=A0ABT6DB21_9LACO|nr:MULTISPECIES: DNA polymerase III subunit gamma/tau [Furfurilactobacillus]QLE67146.1 DNA polymerase III subunits gamma and tau [Furfurilactobacillus rossiae]MCF6161501.1 DNA polymerase III subunit gamma/tau [Furfurilactobacillus milii]MCF6163880.1 DNA polymerase III subunit gamma/tau [Furfurilactobacillus milii]MCF6418844.1 DNA polymerase III subunit gamma/tau [Furfurilactobacillus milii]MCH4011344.1 DNA polymerase III subunit gamma/tau [Furfurilactobacillus sp.]
MSYQALYRVWRPQRFDEIVGQTVITQTLKNAIVTQQTSHAYLFCGPRGTGKTSAAKIFAKAINCPNQKDGEPCNNCDICKAITAGQLNDVIEIDAASNNGVEEIRDIRDKAKYAPTQATYKIYIIDEVHMLSTGAFNALLKTLEEPPANVIFILATTEPHKIPATIISRTQRFDFKRITAQESFDRMVYILKQKQVDFEEPALKVIANAAEGGMRDALSILDQTISFGDNEVTLDNALLVTGSVTESLLADYVKQVVAHETTAGLAALQKVLDDGKDAGRFVEDVISYVRDLLLYKEAPDMVTGSDTTGDVFQQLSKNTDPDVFYQMINALNEVAAQLRFTTHPDVYLEVLTVKLAQIYPNVGTTKAPTSGSASNAAEVAELETQIQQLKQTVSRLSATTAQPQQPAPTVEPSSHSVQGTQTASTTSATPAPTNQPASTTGTQTGKPARAKTATATASHASANVNLAKIYPVLRAATKHDLDAMRDVWDDLLDTLPVTQKAMMHVSKPVAASNEGVIVSFSYAFFFDKAATDDGLRTALESNLNRLTGDTTDVWFVPEDQWPQIRKDFLTDHKEELTGGAAPAGPTTDRQQSPVSDEPASAPLDSPSEDAGISEPENELVTKAQQLFGADNVTIKND